MLEFIFVFPDQINIARIDKQACALAYDENRVHSMEGIDEQHETADETEIPECFRNDASLGSLACNPLDDKTH